MKKNRNYQMDKLIVNNSAMVAKGIPFHMPEISIGRLLARLTKWSLKRKHRDYLLNLPDYLLDDIGITRQQLIDDANRPFREKSIFD